MVEDSKPKDNPYVTLETCNIRYNAIDKKVTEILWALKGNPNVPEDLGIMGQLRDIKRDRKWIYALITCIAIPVALLVIK